jgi:hypothetical protein
VNLSNIGAEVIGVTVASAIKILILDKLEMKITQLISKANKYKTCEIKLI